MWIVKWGELFYNSVFFLFVNYCLHIYSDKNINTQMIEFQKFESLIKLLTVNNNLFYLRVPSSPM